MPGEQPTTSHPINRVTFGSSLHGERFYAGFLLVAAQEESIGKIPAHSASSLVPTLLRRTWHVPQIFSSSISSIMSFAPRTRQDGSNSLDD